MLAIISVSVSTVYWTKTQALESLALTLSPYPATYWLSDPGEFNS